MRKVAINGRIFEFPLTGVGRFCVETIKQIDRMDTQHSFVLLIPSDVYNIPKLKNIEVRLLKPFRGIVWEQITLPFYAVRNNMILLNMSNSIPIVKPDNVVIHDISLKVNKKETSSIKEKIKIYWPLLHYEISAKFAQNIFTVSEFQKNEIIREYGTSAEKIQVVYNGWQHMGNIDEDASVLERYFLEKGKYYFAVSTRAKNKNFKWVMEVAKRNPLDVFVIAGKLDSKYFVDNINFGEKSNIKTTGYLSDPEIKALMKNCKAFLYPSLYEGFGIPPLEAISVGAKVIISNVSCLPEIYKDSAYYINPYNFDEDLNALLDHEVKDGKTILDEYSWERTASIIVNTMKEQLFY